VTCSHLMVQYLRDLIITLRQHCRVAFGPSPSTHHSLIVAACCAALFDGVGYVRPIDIDSIAENVLAHRITIRQYRGGGGGWTGTANSTTTTITYRPFTARLIVQHLITKVLVPPK